MSWSEPSRPWIPARLIVAEVGLADELGVQGQPRDGPRAAVHERDRDDRAHGGLALRQVGAAPATTPGPPRCATTLCEEPVSTTKCRAGAGAEADGHVERDVARGGVTVSGTVVPAHPSARWGRRRAVP